MICDSCILSYRDDEDMLVCDETNCQDGSKYLSACGIPINWIEEQIKKNPGRQMAEECMELGHACLKYSRYLRNENQVHGRSENELLSNIHEEMADVYVTLRELRKTDTIDSEQISSIIDLKRQRMAKRLGLKEDSFIF